MKRAKRSDARPILLGTVRAIQGDRVVVRCPDGRGFLFRLLPGQRMTLGQDVVGWVDTAKDGSRSIDMSTPIDRSTLSADTTIAFFGDGRIGADLLRRLSSGATAFGPGRAGTVRRVHRTGDADLDWALAVFRPESTREGVALNVLNVRALAASPWAETDIADLLPSDTCADRLSTDALLDCLRSGFSPTTRMILESSSEQESVDFILPYNPVVGGWDFVRREAGAARRDWPVRTIPAPAARRLSSARQMALSFATRMLPSAAARDDDDATRAAWRRRLAASFADAAAALAWRRTGGDPQVLDIWASARTSAAASLTETSDTAQRAAILSGLTAEAIRASADDRGLPLLREAAAIAIRTCTTAEDPDNRIRMIELAAEGGAARRALFVDCDAVPAPVRDERRTAWLADLADVMTHLGTEPRALDRLAEAGRAAVPMGFQRIFDLEMEAIGVDPHIAAALDDGIEVEQFTPGP